MSPAEDADIEAIARRLLDLTLPKAMWNHGAHFAAALWLCRHRPDLAEPSAIRRIITRYNEATGTPNNDSSGYHHTITLASMRATVDHLRRCPTGISLRDAHSMLMASDLGRPGWLLAYWSEAVLFSVAARRDWVEPDLGPLPY